MTLRAIQPGARDAAMRRRERPWALSTLCLAGLLALGTALCVRRGWLGLETAFPSFAALLAEVGVFVLGFDLYFYALHRLMHTPWLRRVHAVHHRSTAPGCLTALSFHPVEAFLILLYVPLAIAALPLHLASVCAGGTVLAASITLSHCGREVFPAWWSRTPLLRWVATPAVHDAHHAHFDCNFGATTSIPDRLLGTFRAEARGRA